MTSVIVDSVTCPTVDTVEVLRVVGALVISGQLLLVARLLRVMLWMVRVLYLMNLLWMVCGRSEDCSQLLAYSFLILTMNQFTWRLPPRLDFQAALPVLKQFYNFENDILLSLSILTLFCRALPFRWWISLRIGQGLIISMGGGLLTKVFAKLIGHCNSPG